MTVSIFVKLFKLEKDGDLRAEQGFKEPSRLVDTEAAL